LTIVIPAIYDSFQRESIINSAKFANFKNIRLISETIASVVSVAKKLDCKDEKNILVINFGASAYEIAVLIGSEEIFETKQYGGFFKGGNEIDQMIAEYLTKNQQVKISDLSLYSYIQLIKCCEYIKIKLSSEEIVIIDLDLTECQYKFKLSKIEFEEIIDGLLIKCISCTIKTIKKSPDYTRKIQYILLTGGSTNIPKFQQMINTTFKDHKNVICYKISNSKSSLKGASIYQHQLKFNKNFLVLDSKYSNLWTNFPTTGVSLLISDKIDALPMNFSADFVSNVVELCEGFDKDNLVKVKKFRITLLPTTDAKINKLTISVDTNGICHISNESCFAYRQDDKEINDLLLMSSKVQEIRKKEMSYFDDSWSFVREILSEIFRKSESSDVSFHFE